MSGYVCENYLCEEHHIADEVSDEFEALMDIRPRGCIVPKDCPELSNLIASGKTKEVERTENFILFRWLEE